MVLAFAGRRPGAALPPERLAAVRGAVAELVARERPRVVVGSAAAGADLIVVAAALEAGAVAELLLAGARDRFRAESVADKGPSWTAAFDDLLTRDGVSVRELPRGEDADAAYRAVTAAIATRAEELARGSEDVALLAISPPGDAPSHTEELVAAAQTRGWRVLRIDPLSS